MSPTERSPLLPTTSTSKHGPSPLGLHRPVTTPSHSSSNGSLPSTSSPTNLLFTEDDIAIEGMVLVLLTELEDRGYVVPSGLIDLPLDMPPEEAEAERSLFRTVFAVPRHRRVLNEYLPFLPRATVELPVELGGGTFGGNGTATGGGGGGGAASTSSNATPYGSSTNSLILPDMEAISSPSALLLNALLSLLISLQGEPTSTIQETDLLGVDGELRMFKARRELGERLYAVVGGLLDSYLLNGDVRTMREEDGGEEDGEDALVRLLFHDFPLNYDSEDRATCAVDLLLNLSSYPLVEAEDLVAHPVVLASTEYVWRNGLLPPPKKGVNTALTWTESIVRLDRFSIPRILHSQTYILSTLHAAITIYILMFSAYTHFDSLNPLDPDAPRPPGIPERGAPLKTWSVLTTLVWWLWVAGTFGWAGEVARAWHHRGPHPSLPLSPSTLLPLIHHALVLLSLVLRLSLVFFRRPPPFILATSLSILAWSVPFLAASRVLPQNLPAFGAPTHQRWEKIRDGRKRRELGYRPPPKSVPVSHRALRSLEAHLGGLVQFGSYFFIFGVLLLWSLSGELDYPRAFLSPLFVRQTLLDTISTTSKGRVVSPIEARTTLAFTLVLGVVLAYFAGGRPSISGKPLHPSWSNWGVGDKHGPGNTKKELSDLDGWDRYGREVAFRARRERLAINRYYTFVPHTALDRRSLELVPSAFAIPPLPSPLNLWIPFLLVASFVSKQVGYHDQARVIQERGRLWAWRAGMAPLGLWAVCAKGIRTLRRRE